MDAADRDIYHYLHIYNSYMVEQQHFDTEFELASAATRRDYLAWKAEKGEITEETEPKMITEKEVQNDGSIIKLVVPTDGEGEYHFEIHESGDNQASHHAPNNPTDNLGSLYFAELTDSQEFVNVKEGWFDSRD